MRFDLVGAGRVGKNFAKFLVLHGHTIGHVANTTMDSSRKAVDFIGDGLPSSIEDIGGCDIVFIGTPDDKIRSAFLSVKDRLEGVKAVGHFSGAYSSNILRECDTFGIGRFSVHPNASFAREDFWRHIEEVYFVVEGNKNGKEAIGELLDSLKLRYGEIDSSKKMFYHAAAVFSSNFVVALLEVSKELYHMSGLEEEMAISISTYLAEQAIENVKKMGPKRAITGPVARGDMKLVKAEEMVLQDKAPEIGSLYHKFVKVLREKVIDDER